MVTALVIIGVLLLLAFVLETFEQCPMCASSKVWPDRYDIPGRYCSDCGHRWVK